MAIVIIDASITSALRLMYSMSVLLIYDDRFGVTGYFRNIIKTLHASVVWTRSVVLMSPIGPSRNASSPDSIRSDLRFRRVGEDEAVSY